MSLTINWMIKKAGQEEGEAGIEIEKLGFVTPVEETAKMLRYIVRDHRDHQSHDVTILNDLTCRCSCDPYFKTGFCRHIIASMIHAGRKSALKDLTFSHAMEAGQEMLPLISGRLPHEGNMQLEVTLRLDPCGSMPVRVGLRTGQDKLYVVKHIPKFMTNLEQGVAVSFGKGFEYLPAWMRYSEKQMQILKPIMSYCMANEGMMLCQEDARFLPLPRAFSEELLACLRDYPFIIAENKQTNKRCSGVSKARIPLLFSVTGTLHGLRISLMGPKGMIPLTSSCRFMTINERVIETEDVQREILRFIWKNQTEYGCIIDFSLDDTGRVIGELVPFLQQVGVVDFSPELQKKLVREPLRTAIYLDADGRDIVARTEFVYGETRIDPFQQARKVTLDRGEKLLLRDAEKEQKILDLLGVFGFRVRTDKVYLSGTDRIWDFLTVGIGKLQELAEIYLSRDFERMKPRRPGITGGMSMKSGQIVLDLRLDDEPSEETLALMEALSKHRRYFRMKDGRFLELSGLEEWYDLAYAISEGAAGIQTESGEVLISAAKAAYMDALVEEAGLPVERSSEIRSMFEIEEASFDIPALQGGHELRPYQQHGYRWLRKMDKLHMGGILADAMGTGKTVQIIALLLSAREDQRTSIVVSPTSLTWNWQAEIKRFAPDLSTVVLGGTASQRENVIRHVAEHGDVDVMITSYPLMRRDIDLLKQIRFRYAILDEAQHIKNAASIGAGSARALQADTRFALTGTPMENGVGELWSLFDFIMPGYLPGYSTFLNRYQDGRDHEDLLKRIKPFMLRRLKENVLSEIPEKQETVMTAHMSPEQEKVYAAAMMRLKPRILSLMEEKGLNRGRIEVLAAMTELRQICCHPGLVLDSYRGTSGKMEMLLDLLPGAVAAGHRILLFSQFTSMLKILKSRLEEEGYRTMYLDGETPSRERLELTERFNAGEADVFLISLKAGGSGLNLTGADMVIQYDPWWNPAAEEQAADRAHRIGQKRKVEVIRLVTSESIEEQVVELGERKRALFDLLITPGEMPLNALTEQDINALFS